MRTAQAQRRLHFCVSFSSTRHHLSSPVPLFATGETTATTAGGRRVHPWAIHRIPARANGKQARPTPRNKRRWWRWRCLRSRRLHHRRCWCRRRGRRGRGGNRSVPRELRRGRGRGWSAGAVRLAERQRGDDVHGGSCMHKRSRVRCLWAGAASLVLRAVEWQ